MSDRLSGLETTRTTTPDVQPYSYFIRMIKVVLPLIVFIIIGLLLIWPQISDIETAPLTQQDISALQEAQSENLLLNPVFNTLDDKGKPFSITAHEARQNRDDRDKIVLTAPAAEMNNDDNTFYLEAENGEYDQMRKTLILNNDVVLKDKKNNVLTTQDLTTSIADGKARSNSPAKLTTTQGSIEGQSVIIDQQNQTTTFQGPAKAVINP
tara:strand:+ start:260 stop:889 length:630 start_codon:yes stop_codon:yes gene_type:complete